MIVPEKTSKVRRIVLPKVLLRAVTALSITITAALSFVIYDYVQIRYGNFEAEGIRAENARLVSEVERLQSKMVALNDSLDRVNLFAKKLKVITNFQESSPVESHSPQIGIGPLTVKEAAIHDHELILGELDEPKPLDRIPSSKDVHKLHNQLKSLALKSTYQEQTLQELKNHLDDQAALLGSIPSIWPTRGWRTSKFGYRRSSFTGGIQMHKGIDIASSYGSSIKAPADGVIIEAGYKSDYGKVVVIDHGYNLTTLYGHNSKILVKRGQRVKRGQKIAKLGNTGRSTGAHLHYEVRVNGVPVDPMNYLLN